MRAEIDIQIATAKKYPRSIKRFQQTAKNMATLDEDTAASCMYSLPRGGKHLEGPSVRLAEIIAACWSNLRVGARIVEEGDSFLTAQGFCHDLEVNLAATIEVRRRITGRNGKRFNDDMIQVTGNAAASIAYRNSVFRVVPKAYWQPVFEAARQTALGKAETLVARRTKAFGYWAKAGISEAQILAVVGKASVEDVGLEELLHLRGIFTAVKEGQVTIEQAFTPPERDKPTTAAPRTSLKGNGQKPAEQKPDPSQPVGLPGPKEEPKSEQEDLERQDMIRRTKELLADAKTADDVGNVQAGMLAHKDFLGAAYEELANAAKARAAALAAHATKAPKDRNNW
jgi:hypothetical protein